VTEALCAGLQKSFVFAGISEALLRQVVSRMFGVSYAAGGVVLQQGAAPSEDDCMYLLASGEAEVVITGAVGESAGKAGDEGRQVEGHTVRIPQRPGWLFGDVALLFSGVRTASVVARTNITVWALDRRTFLRFVMKHAQVGGSTGWWGLQCSAYAGGCLRVFA
jgi:CRP-like cAMP-binding protein